MWNSLFVFLVTHFPGPAFSSPAFLVLHFPIPHFQRPHIGEDKGDASPTGVCRHKCSRPIYFYIFRTFMHKFGRIIALKCASVQLFWRGGGSGGARLGRVPWLDRAVLRCMKWAKINRVNSKIKLLKSPENNFDIHIFINPKESINITDIYTSIEFFGSKHIDIMFGFKIVMRRYLKK